MNNIINIIIDYAPYIIILLSAMILILIITTLILLKSISRLEKRYKRLMRNKEAKNLEENILNYMDRVEEVANRAELINIKCENLEEKLKLCLQKVAITRYKAFQDVGSDLSFSIALLDENNDGIVVTGLYSRNDSTTYAKPIDKGISRYDLSNEEIEVLNEAINK